MRSNNFNRIAFIYDRLASIFFAGSIRDAQCHFLNKVPNRSSVLVMGSGTGWIASEILRVAVHARITLVDASEKMSEFAGKGLNGQPINILCADESQKFEKPFDVIMLPFFVDMFSDQKLREVIEQLKSSSHSTTLWIVTDFVSDKWWHAAYLNIMYAFFGIVVRLEANKLPDWSTILSNSFHLDEEKEFFGGFIKTKLFQGK